MATPEKRRGLRLDRDLQHVARKPADEAGHRRFLRRRHSLRVAQHPFDFFLQSDARWYSLHGVDLLSGSASTEPPGLCHQEDTNASLLLQEV
jgi:hypothetical protein